MPCDPVRTAIFPVAGEGKLRAVMAEHRARGSWDRQVQTMMRRSYANHYRRMLPRLPEALAFRGRQRRAPAGAGSARADRPGASRGQAGAAARGRVAARGHRARAEWRSFLIGGDGREARISLIDYEVCALKALRERSRAKEVWVVGAERCRDPDEDLPRDFQARRGPCAIARRTPRRASRRFARTEVMRPT
jgi:hypothetical protein